MPSSYTASARYVLEAPGENINAWGTILNNGAFTLIDTNVNGWLTKALTTDYSLTTANGATDEARNAMLKFTGTGPYTVTIPSVSKAYDVWNAMSGVLTITTGAGTTAVLAAGERVRLTCDGSNVMRPALFSLANALDLGSNKITSLATPTSNTDAATKLYVDNTAFTMGAGALPGQVGNSGNFLTTDGTTASWSPLTAANITSFSASVTNVRIGTTTSSALTPGGAYNALAEVTITYAATVTPDMSTFINAGCTLTGNVTLANPTNIKAGQSGRIRLIQDATGSRLLSAVGSYWKRQGGLASLTTTANAVDILYYDVISPTYILYDIRKSPS